MRVSRPMIIDVLRRRVRNARPARAVAPTEKSLLVIAVFFVLFLLTFSYVPLAGWAMAFVRYIPGVPLWESKFVGLDHFHLLFSFASDLPRVLLNTFALSFLMIICSPLPMLLALLLNEIRSNGLRKFIQTATSLPNFISMVIVYSIFFSLFAVDGGLVNGILLKLGIIQRPINPLGNENATWFFQTGVSVWKSAGWGAIVYLAAIAGVDRQLYDAAKVDGAGRLRQALHVTIPGLLPTYLVLLLLSLGNMLSSSFEQVFMFHNPLVHSRIETLDYFTYRIGLTMFDYSLSTAVGMFKSIASIVLLFIFGRISRAATGHSII